MYYWKKENTHGNKKFNKNCKKETLKKMKDDKTVGCIMKFCILEWKRNNSNVRFIKNVRLNFFSFIYPGLHLFLKVGKTPRWIFWMDLNAAHTITHMLTHTHTVTGEDINIHWDNFSHLQKNFSFFVIPFLSLPSPPLSFSLPPSPLLRKFASWKKCCTTSLKQPNTQTELDTCVYRTAGCG